MAEGNENGQKPSFNQYPETPKTEFELCREDQKGEFNHFGAPSETCLKLEKLRTEQREPILEASIVIVGDEIKPLNSVCLCLTIIGGCLLCLPWFCFCCSWWKKQVWPGFAVSLETYQKLEIILSMPSLKKLSLIVTDNTFDKSKADCLYNMLARSSVEIFNFVNMASGTNWKDKEYSNFVKNMKPIREIKSIRSQMNWHHHIVL